MALTTNANQDGYNGISQKVLVDMIDALQKQIYVITNKLDGDGGVTATDFTEDIENIMTSGAQLTGTLAISTAVQAAIA